MRRHPSAFAAAVLLATLPAVHAQEEKPRAEAKTPSPVVTTHTITVGGKRLAYEATAGVLPLTDDEGKKTAEVFFVAYTIPVEDRAARPVTFCFNGGPGSSSVWLHMGAFGPKRVPLAKDGTAPPPPPARLVDNEHTLLDLTDLVFIDPVTTGYSRAAGPKEARKFHGVEGDVRSVGEFIRLYLGRYERWASPKFLAGESYGTTRAAALAQHLQERHGINLNGVILISAVLNFQTIRFDRGNDLPYVLFLPSYAATAWYHKKLAPELQEDLARTLREAEEFAEGEYATALLKGDGLGEERKKEVAAKVARYTGLSEEFVRRANLRVEIGRFTKELLRSGRRTVGRYDSRAEGIDRDAAGERHEYDPSYAAIQGAYTAAFNHYVRDELQFRRDANYEILTGKVRPWDYGPATNRYLNVADDLRQAMTYNPYLRVFAAAGYYDLATPYFATDYTVRHLGLEPPLRGHVTTANYRGGHMMYTVPGEHRKLKEDLAAFYRSALGQQVPQSVAGSGTPVNR
ncbi:MAG TPA: hypothetical protein VIL46_00165 [Gemmataceae bacterium]